MSGTLPLALIQRSFTLSARDLAAYEHESTSLDLAPLAEAAIEVARREDEVVFAGTRRAPGLTTMRASPRCRCLPGTRWAARSAR